jgi:hypothetical protein
MWLLVISPRRRGTSRREGERCRTVHTKLTGRAQNGLLATSHTPSAQLPCRELTISPTPARALKAQSRSMPSSRRARACARHPQVGDRRRRRSEREWKSGRSRAGIPAKRARRAIGEVRKLLSSSFQIDEGGPILLPGRPFPCVVPCRSLRAEKCARCSQPAWRPSWAVVVVQPRLQERRLNLGATARVQYYLFDVDLGAPPPATPHL